MYMYVCRSSLLAPAHPGGLGKRAVKWLWCGCGAMFMQKYSTTKAVACQNGHIFGPGPAVHIPAFCGPHIVHPCNTTKHDSLYIQRSITTILPLANISIHNSDNIHTSELELSTYSHFNCIYAQQRNMLRTSD